MKPLLLLHGALGAKSQFVPLLALLPSQVPVHAFNLAGHGGEPFTKEKFRIENFAAQLAHWLENQYLSEVNVFGYSMGGYVALEAARQRPDLFAGIFTLATKFNWSPETSEHEAARLRPEVISEKLPSFAQALETRHAPLDWKDNMRCTAEMMMHLGQYPVLTEKTLAQIQVPVRIAVGDRDQMVTVAESLTAFQHLPGAQFQVFPTTKHPLEQLDWHMLQTSLLQFFKYA